MKRKIWVLLLCAFVLSMFLSTVANAADNKGGRVGYVYLSVDDSTYDVDMSVQLVMVEHNWPLTLSTETQRLDSSVWGISANRNSGYTNADPIGNTVLDICKWVKAHGGEIAMHDENFVWDEATATKMLKNYYSTAHTNIIPKMELTLHRMSLLHL